MSYQSVVLADSPSLLWLLGDTTTTAADATGNGKTGTYAGGYAQSAAGPSGVGSNATAFNGSTGFVYQNASQASPDIFSIECWIEAASDNFGIAGYSAGQGVNATNDRAVYLDASANAGFYVYSSGGAWNAVSSGTAYDDNAWHHVVATYSNTAGFVLIYADGVLKGTVSGATADFDYTGYWLCGSAGGTGRSPAAALGSAFFTGTMCAFAVYPVALTSTQVSNHYKAAVGTNTSPAYPASYDIIAGGAGSWVNPANAEGPKGFAGAGVAVPGAARPGMARPGMPGIVSYATWTAP